MDVIAEWKTTGKQRGKTSQKYKEEFGQGKGERMCDAPLLGRFVSSRFMRWRTAGGYKNVHAFVGGT